MNYYNDNERTSAAWLRELIATGLIPDGHVDERSIADVQPRDLIGYTQCHFFAGIGGWPYALRLAGWPEDRPVWTGSCPCQPFSCAGKQRGTADERHLWPEFARLIVECRPKTIFGEQVASSEVVGTQLEADFIDAVSRGDCATANKLARKLVSTGTVHYFARWLDGVFADLEGIGYTCWTDDLPAASVGAPHIRQRLFWVAQSSVTGTRRDTGTATCAEKEMCRERNSDGINRSDSFVSDSAICRLAQSEHAERREERGPVNDGRDWADGGRQEAHGEPGTRSEVQRMANYSSSGLAGRPEQPARGEREAAERGCGVDGVEHTTKHGREQRRTESGERGVECGCGNFWSSSRWHHCLDGKARRVPIESIFQLESDGISCIMGTGWDLLLAEVENSIVAYAKKTNTRPREVLLAMWRATAQEAIRENSGRHDPLQKQTVLLVALCELARHSRSFFDTATQNLGDLQEATMRIVRDDSSEVTAACPPSEQELDGSSPGKSTDPMHQVPFAHCSPEEAGETVQSLREEVSKAFDVSEALSAMEEVWKSVDDKSAGNWNAERIQTGLRILKATNCFPLAPSIPGRVGLLRGAGNAIVPKVAAEFVRAFMRA